LGQLHSWLVLPTNVKDLVDFFAGCVRSDLACAGLSETRREYVHVGLCAASLRPIVSEQAGATQVYAGRLNCLP